MLDEPIPTNNKLTEEIQANSAKQNFFRKNQQALLIVSWIIILALLIGGLVFYHNQQTKINALQNKLNELNADPNVTSKAQIQELIDKVEKLIVLPNDEQPTIATVTDLSKLKDQPFFANAQLGDKVLIYTKAGKAILYRPSTNKIIELAPLTNSQNSPKAPGQTP